MEYIAAIERTNAEEPLEFTFFQESQTPNFEPLLGHVVKNDVISFPINARLVAAAR